jgi:LysM repeat protein
MKQFLSGVMVFSLALLAPAVSHAGIYSVVKDMFREEANAQIIDEPEVNSQNMPLLHAAINTNPTIIKGGAEIAMVNGSSLYAEAGPSGTIANIQQDHVPGGHISTYVVRSGDSLSTISKMFDVSVNTIIWANGIKGGVIHEGQTLVILPISGVQHTVKKGDTLKGVVQKYKADLQEVKEYNNLTDDSVLAVGDSITIPDAEIVEVPIIKKVTEKLTSPLKNVGGPSLPG